MEDKKAAAVLLNMLKKYPFTEEEKDAISEAVGVLSWTSLAESKIKKMKNKQDKDLQID